jgi:hypothetical protein
MEIGRVMVPGQPGQKKKKSFLRPYLSIKKLGMVMSFYYLSDGRKLKIVGCGPGEKQHLISKISIPKRTGGMA